jgi:stage V sporulation protein D (sporulation-specific penicillin-binding protein)
LQNKRKISKESRYRLFSIFSILSILFILILSRLFYIMINNSKEYSALAQSQWTDQVKIYPKRGSILDRNGFELAITADVFRIDLDLVTLRQTLQQRNISIDGLVSKLSNILEIGSEDINKILNRKLNNGLPAASGVLKRKVEKPVADKIAALNLRGIIISPDALRYYPNINLLSQVLGHTDYDGNGITGIELKYNEELAGIPGLSRIQVDNRGNQLPRDSFYSKAVNGKDIVLTIDQSIQLLTEKAAEKALKANKAKSISITVMDPNNGEILAMTNKPDYNLNSPYKTGNGSKDIQNYWKNSAVQNSFEPGSIFKVITAAAALEYDLVEENDRFVCNGSIKIAGQTINCWNIVGHGVQTFEDILKNSCNIGFIELGNRVGEEKLLNFITKLGIGQKTGVDLPGEASGIVSKADSIGPVELATISFGQGIAVTQVQYLAAFNAIANGGTLITPHVMKESIHYEDNKKVIDKYSEKAESRNVINNDISTQLRQYLEKVVTEGVGNSAFVEGLRIGGKTGTAQKVNTSTGGYESGKYIASFAGMAPVNKPKITMLISIDEPDPSNYYAGQTAAPVAKELFRDIIYYLNTKNQ